MPRKPMLDAEEQVLNATKGSGSVWKKSSRNLGQVGPTAILGEDRKIRWIFDGGRTTRRMIGEIWRNTCR